MQRGPVVEAWDFGPGGFRDLLYQDIRDRLCFAPESWVASGEGHAFLAWCKLEIDHQPASIPNFAPMTTPRLFVRWAEQKSPGPECLPEYSRLSDLIKYKTGGAPLFGCRVASESNADDRAILPTSLRVEYSLAEPVGALDGWLEGARGGR